MALTFFMTFKALTSFQFPRLPPTCEKEGGAWLNLSCACDVGELSVLTSGIVNAYSSHVIKLADKGVSLLVCVWGVCVCVCGHIYTQMNVQDLQPHCGYCKKKVGGG